jgi:hypothetical protein
MADFSSLRESSSQTGIHRTDVVLGGRISQSVLASLAMPVLPKSTLSPVPPALSGADQARFSPQLSYFAFFFVAE